MAHMAKTGYINARVEPKLKKDAEAVLERVGVNTSEAVTMFLRQVVLHEGLPFEVRVPNKRTRKAIADLRAGKSKIYTGTTKDLLESARIPRSIATGMNGPRG